MSKNKNPTNRITWVAAPEPTPVSARYGPGVCGSCLAGDCHLCVRVGCYHPHGPEIRSHGLSVGHVEPSPSGDGSNLRTEIDR